MKKRFLTTILFSLLAVGMLVGCGAKTTETSSTGDNTTNDTNASADYFVWDGDDYIMKVTEEGAKQRELVIPKECKKMSSMTFKDMNCQVEVVTFEGDADVDIKSAFQELESLKKIVLPNGIEEIPHRAFKGCVNLEEIVLPENLVSIGKGAFEECKALKELALPDSVETIDKSAFYDMESLTVLYLPKSLKVIGPSVISESGITEIHVPSELELEDYAGNSFITCRVVNVYVKEGSWADANKEAFADDTNEIIVE